MFLPHSRLFSHVRTLLAETCTLPPAGWDEVLLLFLVVGAVDVFFVYACLCCSVAPCWCHHTYVYDRPCGGAVPQLHQEAQCQPPACKRRCREDEGMRRRRRRAAGGADENRDPGDVLQRNPGTQRREHRRCHAHVFVCPSCDQQQTDELSVCMFLPCRTRTRTVAVAQLQPCRPEVRVALIQKTRIRNSNTTELRSSDLNQGVILTEQTQQDQTRPVRVRWIRTSESNPEVSRSHTEQVLILAQVHHLI